MEVQKLTTQLVRIFTKNGNTVQGGDSLPYEVAIKIFSRNKQEWPNCMQVILSENTLLEEATRHFDKLG